MGPRVLALMFHGVVDEMPPYAQFSGGRTCLLRARHFKRVIQWCRDRFAFTTLAGLGEFLGGDSDETRVLVTFDDGLASMVDWAAPVLAKEEVSATVFVTTDWVGSGQTPLVFQLERALWERAPVHVRVRAGPQEFVRDVRSRRRVARATAELWSFLFSSPVPPLALTADMVSLDDAPWRPAFGDARAFWSPATWDELQRGVSSGVFEIGAHGRTHRPWTSLSDAALAEELRSSREKLERRFSRPVIACSYPHGMMDDRVVAAVGKEYRWGFTNIAGLATIQTPRLRMPRTHVPSEEPFWVGGIIARPRAGALVRRVASHLGLS